MKIKWLLIVWTIVVSNVVAYGQKCTIRQDTITNRTIYIVADKMPSFIGGQDSLKSKIYKHLKLDGSCCIEGAVFVSFIVETDGKITNKRIKRGIYNCNADAEALKVVDYLTGWTIGECNGQKVPVEVTVPIRFSR